MCEQASPAAITTFIERVSAIWLIGGGALIIVYLERLWTFLKRSTLAIFKLVGIS